MSVDDLRRKRAELESLIATARAELADVNRDIRRALYRASAAFQRLSRLDGNGRPIRNPVPFNEAHEDRHDRSPP